ncbi:MULTISPECIES: hypothetical protein [unclassified Streptomyces]|uniref:hypothetical protein n=1 Tax=unclassified Streptomyces TaxID=2593676 RepID=UPI000DC3DC22|nr:MULTISPECIES: hypothetical protein [Streptomyces]RAJ66270.1 hypothetical protein K376_00537 [Streptomyces sp. PsTaAH-130]
MEKQPREPEADAPLRPRPDYPPKTPPPPKKPLSPPLPDRSRSELLEDLPVPQRGGRSGRPVMRNRRGAAWTLEAAPWAPRKAYEHVEAQLTGWGLAAPRRLEEVVRLLAGTVVADGGRRISVHVSEQNGLALVLCLSHRPAAADEATDVLDALRELGTDSCGTEMTDEGRQVWALLPVRGAAPGPRGRPWSRGRWFSRER